MLPCAFLETTHIKHWLLYTHTLATISIIKQHILYTNQRLADIQTITAPHNHATWEHITDSPNEGSPFPSPRPRRPIALLPALCSAGATVPMEAAARWLRFSGGEEDGNGGFQGAWRGKSGLLWAWSGTWHGMELWEQEKFGVVGWFMLV